ncbi:MAG: phage baseplate assembly protein V [Thermodesulfobacteriota bacterium]
MTLETIVARLVQQVERRFYGKYRGLVVDNDDPEQLGRLKVRIPSVLGDQVVTGWAFPCLPYGGAANQGTLFVPEVDAGVWIEFEEGNLEYPLWVGSYWSAPAGDSELPRPNGADGSEESEIQAPPTRKIIKTVKGHTLQFEDKDGEEMVTLIEAHNGNRITMNSDGVVIHEGQRQHEIVMDADGITISNGARSHTVVMDDNGISVTDGQAGHAIGMEAGGVTVTEGTAGHTVTLAGSGITIETASGATVELTPAGITIDAGTGVVQIKGSAVLLGPGALPVIRVGDMGVGNLGAPVPITVTTNTQVLA